MPRYRYSPAQLEKMHGNPWFTDRERAAMNMIYSDFVNVAKKLGISNVDFYTGMISAFLDDKDISGDKLAKYYEYVVK